MSLHFEVDVGEVCYLHVYSGYKSMETLAFNDIKACSQIAQSCFVVFDAILVQNSFHKSY